MSIRTSPALTPQLLDAVRSNARRSRGPSTAAGKQHSKMNALEHGERSAPENHYEVMRVLGEDPAQFEALKQELKASFSTCDPFVEKQVDNLTRLYWRRDRLERMGGGLMRRALLELDERQHARRLEIEGAGFEPGQALNIELTEPSDPAARLRLQRSFLAVIREQVGARSFLPWQGVAMEVFTKGTTRWRPARLCSLLKEFAGRARNLAKAKVRKERAAWDAAWLVDAALWVEGGPQGTSGESPAPTDCVAQSPCDGDSETPPPPEPSPAAAEPCADPLEELRYQELLALVEVEIAHTEREFEYEEKMNERRVEIERDACLAPAGEEWRMLLRREEALERAIDRKIKLLLSLRKTAASDVGAPLVGAQGGHKGLPCDESADGQAQKPQTLESRSAPAEDVGAPLVGAPADDEGDRQGRPYEEPAVREAKIDERSGNVIEIKGQPTSAYGRGKEGVPAKQPVCAAQIEVTAA